MAQRTKVKAAVLGAALIVGLCGVLSVVFVARNAHAGKKVSGLASSGVGPTGIPWIAGAMGDTRATTDNSQYVRCEIIGTDDGTVDGIFKVRCTVQMPPPSGSTTPVNKMCWSTHKALVAAAQAIGDSNVALQYNSSGVCTSLTVTQSSEFAPKTP